MSYCHSYHLSTFNIVLCACVILAALALVATYDIRLVSKNATKLTKAFAIVGLLVAIVCGIVAILLVLGLVPFECLSPSASDVDYYIRSGASPPKASVFVDVFNHSLYTSVACSWVAGIVSIKGRGFVKFWKWAAVFFVFLLFLLWLPSAFLDSFNLILGYENENALFGIEFMLSSVSDIYLAFVIVALLATTIAWVLSKTTKNKEQT